MAAEITISQRAYQYIRQFTIKSIEDASVELITNSVDAYNLTPIENRYIWIELLSDKEIRFIDNALGLSAENLEKCFLQVGNYTADDESRGFFSRGAKDISAIGDIYFDSIHNGLHSQCFIKTDLTGKMTIINEQATAEIRNSLRIYENNNGLSVRINLSKNFWVNDIEKLYNSLCLVSQLRDIVSDNSNYVYIQNFERNFEKRIEYKYPESTLILDMEYTIPDYPEYSARFVVNQTGKPFVQPVKENEMEFGFLIKDRTSVYEVTTVDNKYRWDPYISYIFGHIYCDGIRDLLLKYDKEGPSENNPFPILDPSRITGINKSHPFIIKLFSIPTVRIDMILRQLNKSLTNGMISMADFNSLLEELKKLGLQILNENTVNVNYKKTYDGELAEAINDQRGKYVTYESSYQMVGNYKIKEETIEKYIYDSIIVMDPTLDPENKYILTKENKPAMLPRTDTEDVNDPVNILSLVPIENIDDIKANPYVYKLSESGENIEKLYIFSKGTIDKIITDSEFMKDDNLLVIQFINDINMERRYNINYSDIVTIQINSHNPTINKYLFDLKRRNLVDKDISEGNILSVNDYNSTQSLSFIKELFIDIFSQVIVDNDIENGKIVADSSSSTINANKIINYKNSVISKIEVPMETLFQKHIDNNIETKIKKINEKINLIGKTITENFSSGELSSDVILLREQLVGEITKIVE
jgi:hypothetical protein